MRDNPLPDGNTPSFQDLLRFLGPEVCRLLLLGLCAGVALSAVEIAFAFSLQAFLLDLGVMGPGAVNWPDWLPRTGLHGTLAFILLIGLLRSALVWAQLCMQGSAQDHLRFLLRTRIVNRTFHARSASSGRVSTLFNAHTEAAASGINYLQAIMIQLPTALLLAGSMLFMAPRLTAVALAVLAACALPLRLADRAVKGIGDRLALLWARINARLLMSVKNLLLIQIYGTQDIEEERIREDLLQHKTSLFSYYRLSGFKLAVPQLLGVFLICVITLAARSWGGISPARLISYFYLFLRFVTNFAQVNQSMAGLALAWPQTAELEASLRTTANTAADAPAPPGTRLGMDARIGWRLSAVSFTYAGSRTPLLRDLSLDIPPGSVLGITGPSGSGKTTLLALLLGTVDPDQGELRLLLEDGSGEPLGDRRGELLRRVGYVGPESFLIEGTIAENLRYGLIEPPHEDEVAAALRQAECDFVDSLPDGLAHRLTEQGQGLSAGQKQRLSLARALLRKPSVLILDEATANLDFETERRIVSTLSRLKGSMTILAATHRPTLLEIADRTIDLSPREESRG